MKCIEHLAELVAHVVWCFTLLKCLNKLVLIVDRKSVTVEKNLSVEVEDKDEMS